jgi:hypothetical protein
MGSLKDVSSEDHALPASCHTFLVKKFKLLRSAQVMLPCNSLAIFFFFLLTDFGGQHFGRIKDSIICLYYVSTF